ncbi:GPI ethanolamine phosphate transferase 3, catalytic subunit [Nelusetta ayraudi]|uniref:GPI ethanolamine phosphate transferase 3, catalytic subunit n=1 Tax=Nelusetta ayraudi TaxID=303726 RepID=UPI003F7031C2
MQGLRVLCLLAWLCALFTAGIYLFAGGFLLVRLEVNRTSTCGDVLRPEGAAQHDFCRGRPRFRRAVLLVVDALRIDFARFEPGNESPRPYQNKLPVLHEMVRARPQHGRLYAFRADPPTTTMQRIKGFTTGSLPTFVDVGNNFASSAILEDNLIHQLGDAGKRVVFMGDDTWESLFPRRFHRSLPFPSFNVKDLHTVDNGILQHLYTTLVGDDWDVLVAHFLGVDHCGHRFGPDHPAMAAKLTQMDGVIRSVMERLQNDTLLVVLGDHGMTDSGDHGGESQKETDAAIFLYSPSLLFHSPPPSQSDPDLVPQTDLVPTLALLLGVPIPYSSVGQVLLPLFPSSHGQSQGGGAAADAGLSQLEALWINAKQVNRFLETYSALAQDIPAQTLSVLQDQFSRLSTDYLVSTSAGPAHPQLAAALQAYLTAVRDACRATWARFNPAKMAAGVAVLALAVLLCLVVSQRDDGGAGLALAPAAASGAGAAAAAAAATQLPSGGSMDTSWCLAAAALSSGLTLLWGARGGRRTWRPLLAGAEVVPLLVLLLRCASLMSDSYVVFEGRAVTFLLLSLALYVPVSLHWEGLLLPAATGGADSLKGAGLLPPPPPTAPSSVVRRESGTLLAATALLLTALYASLAFHGCREEQGAACSPSHFLSPLARLQDGRLRNLHYLLSVASLGLWMHLLRHCLRHYGNMNAAGGAALVARWLLPLLAVALALHWAVGATPEGSFRGLAELMGVARRALPRTAYFLLGAGLLLIWLRPLTVYVKSRAGTGPGVAAPPPTPPRYRASTGISPQAELHHLIPQIYQRMRRSLDDGELSGSLAGGGGGPAVEAYGLGTVYSAPLLLLCGLLAAGLLLLHADAMAPAFLLLLLEGGALLHIHASCTALRGLQGAPAGFSVPWTPVVLWSLAASQFFHATGHMTTFSSIQWAAAFVGFPEGHGAGTALPATLVTLNTFASHILFAAGCPLLLFWPLVREVREVKEGEDAVMEMRLRERPQQFGSALLQLAARYLFVQGAQVLASVCAAAILRRHLMVWKVFAPKLMFEASGFLVSSAALLVGVALVLRVDAAVSRWFKTLVPDASR